ncbi:single-stranded DNA-binding protein [Nocardioides sp. J2M5]|uniref:single-stranded DNA-binding protein n=1 Tax=Nocardioides palaemonis TaxID=2829810 RepID=UPI001BAD3EBE|nr:single-stranded DNA-binding protein [Nocardioides palaemonis]MBS2937189.1 single-stranded DNA-binding protein [Nocardioides palaemonis]
MYEPEVTLTGLVGGDVHLHELSEGRCVASFRVACTPSLLRDGAWVRGTTSWHTVKVWNRLARHVAASVRRGEPVIVHGRLVADVWERDGTPRTSFEVVASAVGHDLTQGTTSLVRPERVEAEPQAAGEPRAA